MNEIDQLKEQHRIEMLALYTQLADTQQQLANALQAHRTTLEKQIEEGKERQVLLGEIKATLQGNSETLDRITDRHPICGRMYPIGGDSRAMCQRFQHHHGDCDHLGEGPTATTLSAYSPRRPL